MAKSDPVLRKAPFTDDQEIEAAGIEIVERLPDMPRKPSQAKYRAWHYQVRCLRCGHERHMYHASIMHRAAEGIDTCRACAHEDIDQDRIVLSFDYDRWITPPWPVPSHVR